MNLFVKKVVTPLVLFVYFVTSTFGGVTFTLAARGDETTYYFLNDHLGSVDVVLDEQGNVVEWRDYLPYGQERYVHEELNVPDTAQGFTGKELDDETGLNYYMARYYDSEIGRFIQPDPLLLHIDQMMEEERNEFLSDPQNLNAYTYAKNNPVKYVDTDGEEAILAALIVAAVFVSTFLGVQNVAAPAVNSQPVYTKSDVEVAGELVTGAIKAAAVLGAPKAMQKIVQFGFRTAKQLRSYRQMVANGVDPKVAAQRTSNYENAWGKTQKIEDHFVRHGEKEFGYSSAEEYTQKAQDFFYQKGIQRKIDVDGTVRVYDSKTNTFGAYNSDGTIKTFMKPGGEQSYFNKQQGVLQK